MRVAVWLVENQESAGRKARAVIKFYIPKFFFFFLMFVRVSASLKAFGEIIKMQPGLLEAGWD